MAGFFLSKIDYFGSPYSLKFNGSDSFKTSIGGVLTIIYVAFMTGYIFRQTNLLYNRDDPAVTEQEEFFNPRFQPPINATDLMFDLAFKLYRTKPGSNKNVLF
jgi:hypothetical protein